MKNRRAELRSIVLHARSLGSDARQKGDTIYIGGRQYDSKSIDSLPQEFSLEASRTKKVGQNTIGFYSGFSPLSNFHRCSFVFNNVTYQGRSLAQIRGGAVPPEQVPGGNFSVTFGDN